MLYTIIDCIRSKENKKSRFALILVLLLTASITSFFVYTGYKRDNVVLPPLTEEERELLGEWKFTRDGPSQQNRNGYVLLGDHKCIGCYYGADTTDVIFQSDNFLWWREGGRLTIRAKNAFTREIITLGAVRLNRQLHHDLFYDLNPDGLGGFLSKESTRIDGVEDTPSVVGTGKLSRVERKSN